MANVWPKAIDDLIREAVAAEMKPSVALRKLRAGTLEGLPGPVAMPERSFYRKWRRAKEEQRRAAVLNGDAPEEDRGVLERIVAELNERDAGQVTWG
jgi:hypothetical protein